MKEDLELFNEITNKLLEKEKEEPVAEPIDPSKLFETLDLELEDQPTDQDKFQNALKEIVLNTPRTATNQFFNQLFGGRKGKAVLGDLLAVMLNNSMYTYKVAGPMVGVEKEIMHKVRDLVGYPKTADGTIAPGGSMTNFMGMLMARDKFNESIKNDGVSQKMTLYTSQESHYSIPKNAAFMGIGRNQVRYVPTDDRGRMDTAKLKDLIEADKADGCHPFMVIATAGTTVLGAFDPIDEINEICEEHNMWSHVDGAYCGSVIFSENYRHLVKGAQNADSFTLNAHKMLAVPLSCSIIVVKDKKYLYDSFSNDADYLYQTDGDDYNLGKISLQCGRRNDALKFWTLWKAVGTSGLGELVDHQFELAQVARDYVRDNSDYKLYSFDESISVCFNYKDIPADVLCSKLYKNAELMVGYGQYEDEQFVRLVTINSSISKQDVLDFFDSLEAFANEHLKSEDEVKAD
ncbi:aminotransferase class V-fold PLP-dependent enzyme [Salibacter halophilus]|uniref:Aminotransferase class V-fold PLP-dependent enzyme n=1 Tax=Salibacter halophilus TaxID=1803916 RepID=A0A6N6M6Q0_9FLAO|nr:aminotransferase class V-fold PLP-dependent enzyme [Salibacter halophilus]